MTQPWRMELRAWTNQYAANLSLRSGVLGIILGGSLARGQEWRHSDMEIGILVEERDQQLPYFNVDSGRGVEIIQLVRPELEVQVRQVEAGDLTPIFAWPIQLWAGRVIIDPTGLLSRFKRGFDDGLFKHDVLKMRLSGLHAKIEKGLNEAHQLLNQGRPVAALVRARLAMNEAILAMYWAHGELPRSQNRTDSRLRWLCRKYAIPQFYELYREAFGLTDTQCVIRTIWPKVKQEVLEITRAWGDSARDFFLYAVDGEFKWRQNAGILTVYRLYVPIIGATDQGIFARLDDPN